VQSLKNDCVNGKNQTLVALRCACHRFISETAITLPRHYMINERISAITSASINIFVNCGNGNDKRK